jgi:hypothetical protein
MARCVWTSSLRFLVKQLPTPTSTISPHARRYAHTVAMSSQNNSGVHPVTPPRDTQSEGDLTGPPSAPRHSAACWEVFLRFRLTACTLRQVHRRGLFAQNEYPAVGAERDSERTTKELLEFSESASGQRTAARWFT